MKVESVAIFCMELSLVSFGLSMCQYVRLVGQVDGSDDHHYHHHPHKCDVFDWDYEKEERQRPYVYWRTMLLAARCR